MARPSGINEKLRNELKTLCIDWAIARMKGKQENIKKEIVLKVLPKVFPTELVGKGDGPIEIIKYAFGEYKDNLHTESLEQTPSRGEGEMESPCPAPESGENNRVPESSD